MLVLGQKLFNSGFTLSSSTGLTIIRALIRSQPDIIVSQISAITNAPQITKAAATSTLVSATVASSIQLCQPVGQRQELQSNPSPSNIARLYQKKQRGQHRNLTTRYRRRVCLVNWMWDFEVLKSRSGWTINLRTCHIVPFESRFMQLMRKLDLRGIEELFDQGQASTSVVTIDGMSILEVNTYTVSLISQSFYL